MARFKTSGKVASFSPGKTVFVDAKSFIKGLDFISKPRNFLEKAMFKVVGLVLKEAVKNISTPPLRAIDTGALRGNITPRVATSFGGVVEGVVGTGPKYGFYVHEGFTHRSGAVVPPRPFLRKAAEDNFKKIMDILGDSFVKFLKDAKR